MAYSEYLVARRVYDSRVKKLELETFYDTMMSWLYFTVAGIKQGVAIYQQVSDYQEAGIKMALNSLEYFNTLNQEGAEAVEDAVPATVGAGLTVITSPRSFVEAAMSAIKVAGNNTTAASKMTLKNSLITSSIPGIALSYAFDEVNCWVDYYQQINSIVEGVRERASAVNEAESDLQASIVKMNMAVEAYNAEVAKGETCLAEREAARKVHANRIAQARYNDMFFRLQRNTALSRYSQSFALAQRYVFLAAQAYDYETALLSSDPAAGDAFKAKIVAARALGDFDADGQPIVASAGDAGLAGLLAQMDANWQALKPRLGINNPQNYATWFSLRRECFRILGDEKGDEAWAQELAKYWVEDIQSDANFIRYCQPFYSQYGLKDKEPGLIIPFETTIDFAKNLFGKDLAGGDATYDSTWYATRIAAAGLWFDGYNARADGYAGNVQLSTTPVAYLVPIGNDRMRVPGAEEGTILQFSVVDQVVPAPYTIGSSHLDNAAWVPSMLDGDYAGADSAARIRRHPSFRAYFDPAGGDPAETCLDATRLVGRSVWNTKWLLVIPAGAMNSDRDKALSVFIRGSDENRDGQLDLKPVSDIRIGFKTYSTSGN